MLYESSVPTIGDDNIRKNSRQADLQEREIEAYRNLILAQWSWLWWQIIIGQQYLIRFWCLLATNVKEKWRTQSWDIANEYSKTE